MCPQICKCANNCRFSKNHFFFLYYWYKNLLFFKISHSAHSYKMLLLGIDLLDRLILNCMELLTSFKSDKEV